MDSNYIWILIGKKLTGEASVEELREFELLMKQGLGDIYPIHVLEDLWKTNPATPPVQFSKALNDKWLRFEARLRMIDEAENEEDTEDKIAEKRPWRKYILWSSGLAACLLLGLGIFWRSKNPGAAVDNRITEITAPKGSISKILLPDGSRVWLNSGSKLKYENQFGTQFRKVSLTGEAFFDVVKDAGHPFIVTTNSFQVKVLGTAFNVRSYPNDKTSEAALVRGKIQIKLLKNPDKEITLLPSEKLVVKNTVPENKQLKKKSELLLINNDIPLITLSTIHQSVHDTLPAEALWMENKLAFDGENFEEIASKMQRWFSVRIEFKNNNVKKLTFSGVFKNESLDQTLSSLQSTYPFHYNIKDNNVYIY